MKRSFLLSLACTVLGAVAFTVGCGTPQNGQRPPAQQQQDNPLAPRDQFEATKDVQIGADTHFAAGQFAESQGNLAQAMEQYRKALTLNPNHRNTIYHVAVVYVKEKKLPQAIEWWNRYVKVTNGDATAYANLGFAYELAGKTADAEAAYQKGVRHDPANAACRVNYGLMLARKERFNEATLQLQTVLSEAEVHYNLASVYESLNRKEQARIEYRKALAVEPEMKEAQARLAALN